MNLAWNTIGGLDL